MFKKKTKLKIGDSRCFIWAPQRDITAYEVALCMKMLVGGSSLTHKVYDGLPEEAKRHFKVINHE